MSEGALVLDTSTLSEVIKGRSDTVRQRAQVYLSSQRRFTFSILTRFEILRGLYAKGAVRQIEDFEVFCSRSEVLPLTDAAVVNAARIYGLLRNRGEMIDDLDILIAATALANKLGVATENIDHFRRIAGLEIESWKGEQR